MKQSSNIEVRDVVKDVDLTPETNIQFQINYVLQHFNELASNLNQMDKEPQLEIINKLIRNLELILIPKIINYKRSKYNEEMKEIAKYFEKTIKKINNGNETNKEEKVLDMREEYLRRKFETLVRISQTSQAQYGVLE